MPGKGVWAPQQKFGTKATIGAVVGTALGAVMGRKSGPFVAAAYSVGGLVLGHEVGAMFDKVDQMYAASLLDQTLHRNPDGQMSTWSNPNKPVTVTAGPVSTNGDCREFVSDVTVKGQTRQVRGTACKRNGVWELREMY